MIIDTHAHYDDEAFDADREELLASLAAAGVGRVIDVGSTKGSLARIRELTRKYPFVYGALGLHPDEVGDLSEETFAGIEEGLSDPKILAVGEIGLDYYWNREARDVQIAAFRRQALLAIRHGLPIIIHSREAAADTLDVARELYGPGGPGAELPRKGVMHCYSYSAELARIYTRDLGFYLGIGGVVTYKNGRKLKEVVLDTPIDYLLLETDCPYLSPVPFRGKRNSSLNLPYIIEEIASIKGITPGEVEAVTAENARKLFALA